MRFVLAITTGLLCFISWLELPAQAPKWKPSPHVAVTDPLPPVQQLKKFQLPPGFEIQLVAAEPDINKPINIAVDAKGRVWVTGSVEYPYAAKDQGRDKVWVLDDFGPDGRARKITTFADGLNIPIGVLPTSKGAMVFSIPSIYHLVDTDGDGKADRRDVLYTNYGHNDTHGMTGEFMWGLDGWVYACHGFSNTSQVKDREGMQQIQMHSGNTYRFKPDGSRIEYFTHGQVNPFGLAWDVAGNLYSCDCHSKPLYQLLKGAWYPSFAKPHDGLGFGPEMIKHSHGSTAIAGIAISADDTWPAEFRHNTFIGNVMTNRINRDRIDWSGSSPRAVEMPDFVKCDDPWFRPVDIKLGPDGALYVADFYNRIIGHYEVPLDHPGRDREKGRIWRIVYRGTTGKSNQGADAPRSPTVDLTTLSTPDLVARLGSGNLTVRMQAVNLLAERGGPEVVKQVNRFLDDTTLYPHAYGLWVLERLAALDRQRLEQALKSPERLLRIHAMRILAERDKWQAGDRDLVLGGLRDADALVQRCAVQGLASHPQPENLGPLLEIRGRVPTSDTHLLHAVRIALRDQLLAEEAWKQVPHKSWQAAEWQAIADVCPGLKSPESASFLVAYLQRGLPNLGQVAEFTRHVARYGSEDEGKSVLAWALAKHADNPGLQAGVFKAVHQGRQESGRALKAEERKWAEELARRLLDGTEAGSVQQGIELAGALNLQSAADALFALVGNPKVAEAQRRSAAAALSTLQAGKYLQDLAELLNDPTQPTGLREQIAQSLGTSPLPKAPGLLAKALESAPARLQTAIALGLASSPKGAEQLFQAVEKGKASARLLQETQIEQRLLQAKLPKAKERLAKLTKGLQPLDQRVQELIVQKSKGFAQASTDAKVGVKLFEKTCALCHQVGNKGAKLGPQLDGVGIRGVDRLLEDLLDPSRNVDQAFRATTLVLSNGQLVVGLFLRQDGEVLVMADAQGKEVRVDGKTVQDRLVAPVSPMPGNVIEQLRDEELYHLLAFLLEQRGK